MENIFEDQGEFIDSIDHLIPDDMKFQTLDEKKSWIHETIKFQRIRQRFGEDQSLRNIYLKAIKDNFVPLHKDMYEFDYDFIQDKTRAWLENQEVDDQGVPTCCNKEWLGVYSFGFLKPEFNVKWMEEIAHFKKFCEDNKIPAQAPNTMNNYGVILDDIGFKHLIEQINEKVISPISKQLWWDMGQDSLDHHHAFTVEYAANKDKKLDLHRDDSEVTVNYCLGTDFKGGVVRFQGMRCLQHSQTGPEDNEIFEYENVPGNALIHQGRHKHLAKDIISGERYNIILWYKSSEWRSQNRHENSYDPNRPEQKECPRWCWYKKIPGEIEEQHLQKSL